MERSRISFFLACLVALPFILQGAGAQSLSISPPNQNASNFSLSITVNVSVSASNLFGYQYDIFYDSGALSVNQSGIVEAPFLKTGGVTTLCVPPSLATLGMIRFIACTRTGPNNVSGTGNITTITFLINQSIALPAVTQIGIANSKLSNINGQPISHAISNGTISIYSAPGPVCGANGCESGETCSSCPSDCGQCPCPSGQTRCSDGVCRSDCGGGGGGGDGGGGGGGGACTSGQTRDCSLAYKGKCSQGTETCVNSQWTGCPVPSSELCNKIDDDCDSQTDESLTCICFLGESRACGSNVGECREGTRQCSSSGIWADDCTGDTRPSAEVCDGKDNDCDNEMDEECMSQENITTCQDGLIPETGCQCGDNVYTIGFCYGGVYSETGPPEFPWITLTIIGVIVFLILTIIIIYKEFYRKGKSDITWEELMSKYKSSFYELSGGF